MRRGRVWGEGNGEWWGGGGGERRGGGIRRGGVVIFFFFQAEDGIRDVAVTGVQTCALPISAKSQAKTPEPKKEDAKKEEAKIQTEEAQPKTEDDAKLTSVPGGKALGMSILGNQEAPKALVIVPWKSSELGNGPNVSTLLDDSRRPVDKEVFLRMLSYYAIRSATARPSGATTDGNAAAPANAAQRRKP